MIEVANLNSVKASLECLSTNLFVRTLFAVVVDDHVAIDFQPTPIIAFQCKGVDSILRHLDIAPDD